MRRTPATLALLGLPLLGCAPAPEDPGPLATARSELTVDQEIAKATCSTSSSVVQGLSDQILDEIAKCLKPGVLVKVSDAKIADSSVHPYLVKPAFDALVKATAAKGATIHVSSMFRTVAQQYFLWRRSSCYPAVADPGSSNHETGIAIDVSDPDNSTFKTALEANGWKWLGSFDHFHFDYVGAGSVNLRGQDVLAFQRLWNRNNPTDKIDEDGAWGPQTEARMKKAPAGGFATGAVCGTPPPPPKPWPDLRLDLAVQGVDRFGDGASAGVVDALEGDDALGSLVVENAGDAAAKGVVVGVWTESPFLLPSHYDLEVSGAGGWTKDTLSGTPASDLFTVGPFDLAAGQKKRVQVQLKAARYSLGTSTPTLRAWVKSVPSVYEKADYGTKPTNVEGRQTWNSGDLRDETRVDVFSRVRWSFDGGTAEGWTATSGTVDGSVPAKGLVVTPTGAGGVTLLGPTTRFSAATFRGLALEVTTGAGPARLSFADDKGAFSAPVAFDLAPGMQFVDLTQVATYQGTVTQLRLELPPGTVELADLRLSDGTAGPPPAEGSDGGCGCRVEPRRETSAIALSCLVSLVALRRRRRR